MVTRDTVIELLKSNDRAVARALVVLTERQTQDEQRTEHTRYRNGQGFRPCHARMGTSMSKFYQARGYLTAKQVAYWRAPMRDGKMRIEIYAGQLVEVAQAKAAARTAAQASVAAAAPAPAAAPADERFDLVPLPATHITIPQADAELEYHASVAKHCQDQAEAARIAEDAAARDAEAAAMANADRQDQERADYHSLHEFLAQCRSLR
jgi:hypothetical protein